LRVCYKGVWYNTRFVPPSLFETILQSPEVDNEHIVQLQKMVARMGVLSFFVIFRLARAEARR
ncbi:YlaC family protein, partial [Salmonella enterica]|uniref:YlaC family protein n=1 Tax=Salmonella enterica TaxID=28901 RepID=UPI003EDBFE8A